MSTTVALAPFDPAVAEPLAAALGAPLAHDDYGPSLVFGEADAPLPARFVCALPDLGLLEFAGDDTVAFLQSQLTNDVAKLGDGRWQWNGYCTAKGRLLSTSMLWRADGSLWMSVSRPAAETLRKRLSMFVLRAKVRVADRSAERVLLGVGGDLAAPLAALGLEAPGAGEVRVIDGIHLLGLAPLALGEPRVARCLLAVPFDRVADVWRTLVDAGARPAGTATWRWTEVRAGVPRIVPTTWEQFVPQMLSFDHAGGVSFRKGCYPGQEVVARTHFLGKLKRRLYAASGDDAMPAPGSDVVVAGAAEPIGRVVVAAPRPGGGFECLFEAPRASVETDAGVATAAGERLRVLELPYQITDADRSAG